MERLRELLLNLFSEEEECYRVTVKREYRENSGSDMPIRHGDKNEKTSRTRVKVTLIAKVHIVLVQVEIWNNLYTVTKR